MRLQSTVTFLPPKGGVPPQAGRGEGEHYVSLTTRLGSPSVSALRADPPPPTGEERKKGATRYLPGVFGRDVFWLEPGAWRLEPSHV